MASQKTAAFGLYHRVLSTLWVALFLIVWANSVYGFGGRYLRMCLPICLLVALLWLLFSGSMALKNRTSLARHSGRAIVVLIQYHSLCAGLAWLSLISERSQFPTAQIILTHDFELAVGFLILYATFYHSLGLFVLDTPIYCTWLWKVNGAIAVVIIPSTVFLALDYMITPEFSHYPRLRFSILMLEVPGFCGLFGLAVHLIIKARYFVGSFVPERNVRISPLYAFGFVHMLTNRKLAIGLLVSTFVTLGALIIDILSSFSIWYLFGCDVPVFEPFIYLVAGLFQMVSLSLALRADAELSEYPLS